MAPASIKVLNEKHLKFMDWLMSEDYVVHQHGVRKYAEQEHISTRTLYQWKNDPVFIKEWEKRVYGEHRSPEKVDRLLDVLYKKGMEGDVKAIGLHMQLMDRMTPTAININKGDDRPLEKYTDDELAAMIATQAQTELEKRAESS